MLDSKANCTRKQELLVKKLVPTDAVLIPDSAKRAFEGMIFDVYQWPQELFDGSSHTFEMLKRPDTVSVICIVDGKLLMLDDEQPHLGRRKTFPGGRVDPSDPSIQAAAQREVLEETGYAFNQWRLVEVRQPFSKFEWFVHVFLAWEPAEQQAVHLDPGEKIQLNRLTFAGVVNLMNRQEGHLGENLSLFAGLQSVDDLLALPEFSGQEVDR